MRLSVSVDPELLDLAAKVSGAHTKREAIERALHALIQEHRRAEAIRHAGAFRLTLTRRTLRRLRQRD
jgi:Arc/MetJ family transcription regulator